MFLSTKSWKLLSLGPTFYKKLLSFVWSLVANWHVIKKFRFRFLTFQTWLDLKFLGSSSFKPEDLKMIMVKPDLTWTWNSKFGFKFSGFQGPLVSKIDWCRGHWWGSTYMVVRLSNVSSETGNKCIFCVFRLFLPLRQTASRPYRLSYINALCIN